MILRRHAASILLGLALGGVALFAFAESPREGFAPDPPVHPSTTQWHIALAYQKGVTRLVRATSTSVSKPLATPRAMGRFALELSVGRELLDRVRFDVPLLGDQDLETDPKRKKKPQWSAVTTRLRLQMADHPRATILTWVDRATGATQRYFWPPDEDGSLRPFSLKTDAGSDTPAPQVGAAPGIQVDAAPDNTQVERWDSGPPFDAAPDIAPAPNSR